MNTTEILSPNLTTQTGHSSPGRDPSMREKKQASPGLPRRRTVYSRSGTGRAPVRQYSCCCRKTEKLKRGSRAGRQLAPGFPHFSRLCLGHASMLHLEFTTSPFPPVFKISPSQLPLLSMSSSCPCRCDAVTVLSMWLCGPLTLQPRSLCPDKATSPLHKVGEGLPTEQRLQAAPRETHQSASPGRERETTSPEESVLLFKPNYAFPSLLVRDLTKAFTRWGQMYTKRITRAGRAS